MRHRFFVDGTDEYNYICADGKLAPFQIFDAFREEYVGPRFRFRWLAVFYVAYLRVFVRQ